MAAAREVSTPVRHTRLRGASGGAPEPGHHGGHQKCRLSVTWHERHSLPASFLLESQAQRWKTTQRSLGTTRRAAASPGREQVACRPVSEAVWSSELNPLGCGENQASGWKCNSSDEPRPGGHAALSFFASLTAFSFPLAYPLAAYFVQIIQ